MNKEEEEKKKEENTETKEIEKEPLKEVDTKNKFNHPTHGLVDRGDIEIVPKHEHTGTDGKKFCSYGVSTCTQRPMKGYEFCVKHILQG